MKFGHAKKGKGFKAFVVVSDGGVRHASRIEIEPLHVYNCRNYSRDQQDSLKDEWSVTQKRKAGFQSLIGAKLTFISMVHVFIHREWSLVCCWAFHLLFLVA